MAQDIEPSKVTLPPTDGDAGDHVKSAVGPAATVTCFVTQAVCPLVSVTVSRTA